MGSVVVGLIAPWHVESSQTRDCTCIPCIGRWIFNHREALMLFNLFFFLCYSILINFFLEFDITDQSSYTSFVIMTQFPLTSLMAFRSHPELFLFLYHSLCNRITHQILLVLHVSQCCHFFSMPILPCNTALLGKDHRLILEPSSVSSCSQLAAGS